MNAPLRRPPSELARETLAQLALRRLPPTPENYTAVYAEVSGVAGDEARSPAAAIVDRVAAALEEAGFPGEARDLRKALSSAAPERAAEAIAGLGARLAAQEALDWSKLIRLLVRQLDLRHQGVTAARKREALEHVLTAFAGDPAKLHAKLRNALRAWGEGAALPAAAPDASAAPEGEARADPLREQIAETLQNAVTERYGWGRLLVAEATQIAGRVRQAEESDAELGAKLRAFWTRAEMSRENPADRMQALAAIIHLMLDNLGQLIGEDQWLAGQVAVLRETLGEPLSVAALRDVERNFRSLVYRQGVLKHSLDEAKLALKEMLTTFVDRLGSVAASTGKYNEKLARYSERIEGAHDIAELGGVVQALMQDSRELHTDMVRAHDELDQARRDSQAATQRVEALQRELELVSSLAREDALTRTLNRRGLHEAFAVETSRSLRDGKPLSVALLDVDNFKALNDRLGHQAGDDALRHLSSVIKSTLRPTDVVSRYGGEEFVILLPGTEREQAAEVVRRLQRELTRRYFLHDNERLLVTFSAGVATWFPGEAEEVVIARADAAVYRAKREGKNRVIVDETPAPAEPRAA